MLNLPAEDTDKYSKRQFFEFSKRRKVGDFPDEPLDLQRGPRDPSQDRGRGPCRGDRGGGSRHFGAAQFGRWLCPDGRRDQGRQAGDGYQRERSGGALTEKKEFVNSRGPLPAPKVATWI